MWWNKIYGLYEFKTDFKKFLRWKLVTIKRTVSERGMESDNIYYYAQMDLLREINKQYKLKAI